MDFVTAVHKNNTEVAKLLATGFFDGPLWERRLHFSVYKAEQLVQLAMLLDVLPGGAELCVATASELLSHRCTEVRHTYIVECTAVRPTYIVRCTEVRPT